ncbi:MAG: hypothetical protein SGJ18_14275 [Pseudomonadota bacterium]|nr:hypothetical protein [Pseudomonadota bacterium]
MTKSISLLALTGFVFLSLCAVAQESVEPERVFNTLTPDDEKFLDELDYILTGGPMGRLKLIQAPQSVNTLVAAGYSVQQLTYFEAKEKNHKCVIELKFVGPSKKSINIYYDAFTIEMKSRCNIQEP